MAKRKKTRVQPSIKFVDDASEQRARNLDPYEFYLNGAKRNEATAQGPERWAYQLFGSANIASVTLAIDPLQPFRQIGQQYVPTNRSRTFTASGTPYSTKVRKVKRTIQGTSPPDTSTPDPFDRLPYSESTSSTTTITSGISQARVVGSIDDTTERTRPLGNENGELELWIPRIHAHGTSRTSIDDSDNWAQPNNYRYRTADVEEVSHIGPCAVVSAATVANLKTSMRTNLLNLMGTNTLKMVLATNPKRRLFSAAYSVGELKDLPRATEAGLRTLIAARRYAMSRAKSFEAKRAAGEFVSYEFGWKQMWQDISRFINLPEKLSKKVNFLMRRNGKLTTLRTTWGRDIFPPTTVASPPSFTHTLLPGESQVDLKTEALIYNELRLVVKTVIDFPRLEVPEVRKDFVLEQLGISPTPEDVYNLIPWTWLNDWFTGLGDYVSCYDRINFDPQLVDSGCITGISTLSSKSLITTERQTIRQRAQTPPVPAVYFQDVNPNRRTREARLECKLQIRRSLSSAYGVKPAWDLPNLTGFQLSILGALFYIKSP